MKCIKCGNNNNDGTLFCTTCGNKLENNLSNNTLQSQIQNNLQPEILGINNNINNNTNSNQQTTIETLDNIETSENKISQPEVLFDTVNTNDNFNPGIIQNENIETNMNVNVEINANKNNKVNNYFKKNSKLILIVICIIVLLGVFFGINRIFFKESNEENLNNIFDAEKLIPISEDGKIGFINNNGDIVIEPTYKEKYGEFTNGYIKVYDDNLDKYKIIDTENNTIFENDYEDNIEYIPEYELFIANNKIYNSKKEIIFEKEEDTYSLEHIAENYFRMIDYTNDSVNIIDQKGNVNYTQDSETYSNPEIIMSEINNEEITERYCIIENGLISKDYSLINCKTGDIIIDTDDEKIIDKGNNIFEINNKDYSISSYYIYVENNNIHKFTSEGIPNYFCEKYIKILSNTEDPIYYSIKNKNYVDSSNTELNKIIEDNVDYEIFEEDKKFGIKVDGKITVPAEYDLIIENIGNTYSYLKNNEMNYIYAEKDDNYFMIDYKENKVVENFGKYYPSPVNNTTFLDTSNEGNHIFYNFVTKKKIEIIKEENRIISYEYTNYIIIKIGNTYDYYNMDFEKIYTSNEM